MTHNQETELEKLARLQQFFTDEGIVFFSAKEMCTMRKTPNRAIAIPPEKLWPNIIPTLRLSDMLRAHMGHPLSTGNGYRHRAYNKAVGGARFSSHLKFRAHDMDLPMSKRSRENQEKFYEAACELFIENGKQMRMGLGLYRPWRGTRLHIDTGRYWGRASWKSKYVNPLLESLR